MSKETDPSAKVARPRSKQSVLPMGLNEKALREYHKRVGKIDRENKEGLKAYCNKEGIKNPSSL